jgi:glycosyltransferase involved in cell wall biosynthesis
MSPVRSTPVRLGGNSRVTNVAAPTSGGTPGGRIGVLVVAYNAASTLTSVLDRLPRSFRDRVDHVLVGDDASHDDTYRIGLGYRAIADLPLTVVRHPVNLGYGGNQKAGYRWALEHGLDIVVLLHGDGQYAPEVIEDLVRPLEDGRADAVFGSRIMVPGAARAGGMPRYKYVGNRILTAVENRLAGLELSEWHSGYRAYRVDALADIPFERNSDGFDFDTEIILQLHEAGKTILEVPIPTYYGDEICHVDGLRYARDVLTDVARYRLHKLGFGSGEMAFADDAYELKMTPTSSHGQLLERLAALPPSRVLDLGCSDGRFGALVRAMGHHVVGVDVVKHPEVGDRVDDFFEADLDGGIPVEAGGGFDVVVLADVLEHTVAPERVLVDVRERLAPSGTVLVSIPNFAHWYPRVRVASGRFDYDRRGILDSSHIRFFTRPTFERLAERADMRIRRHATSGLPVEVAERGGDFSISAERLIASIDKLGVALWPKLFGYQFLFELEPAS